MTTQLKTANGTKITVSDYIKDKSGKPRDAIQVQIGDFEVDIHLARNSDTGAVFVYVHDMSTPECKLMNDSKSDTDYLFRSAASKNEV